MQKDKIAILFSNYMGDIDPSETLYRHRLKTILASDQCEEEYVEAQNYKRLFLKTQSIK
jgi:hypothetical protein